MLSWMRRRVPRARTPRLNHQSTNDSPPAISTAMASGHADRAERAADHGADQRRRGLACMKPSSEQRPRRPRSGNGSSAPACDCGRLMPMPIR